MSVSYIQTSDGDLVKTKGDSAGNLLCRIAYSDGMGRARVSQPYTIVDYTSVHGDNNDAIHADTYLVGDAKHVFCPLNSLYRLSVSRVGDKAVRQPKVKGMYQPGKSLTPILSCNFNSASRRLNDTCVASRVGYFDDDQGVFFEYYQHQLWVVVRKNGVDAVRVSQQNFNMDTLDGTGPSKMMFDPTCSQIVNFDLQWLGVGSVHFYLWLHDDRIPVHAVRNVNYIETTWTRFCNLPLRWEIEAVRQDNDVNDDNEEEEEEEKEEEHVVHGEMACICGSVQSDAGFFPTGTPHCITTYRIITTSQKRDTIMAIVVNKQDIVYHGISVRIDKTSPYRYSHILLRNLSVSCETESSFIVFVYYTPSSLSSVIVEGEKVEIPLGNVKWFKKHMSCIEYIAGNTCCADLMLNNQVPLEIITKKNKSKKRRITTNDDDNYNNDSASDSDSDSDSKSNSSSQQSQKSIDWANISINFENSIMVTAMASNKTGQLSCIDLKSHLGKLQLTSNIDGTASDVLSIGILSLNVSAPQRYHMALNWQEAF